MWWGRSPHEVQRERTFWLRPRFLVKVEDIVAGLLFWRVQVVGSAGCERGRRVEDEKRCL